MKTKESLFIGKDSTPVFEKETSKKLDIPLDTVEKVISFISKKTHQAFKTELSVELSGFGTFLISEKRLKYKIIHLTKKIQILEEDLRLENSEKLRKSKSFKIENLKTYLKGLTEKAKNED